MNLVGHVAVARPDDGSSLPTDFLVGCMLPDLAAIARVRLTRPTGDLGRGVEYHHACDHAFHESTWFRTRNVRAPGRVVRRRRHPRSRSGVLACRHRDAARRCGRARGLGGRVHPPGAPRGRRRSRGARRARTTRRPASAARAPAPHRLVARPAPVRRGPLRRRTPAAHDRRAAPDRALSRSRRRGRRDARPRSNPA